MDKLARPEQVDAHEYAGRMVRLKKGEEKPARARLMTDGEVLSMQHKIMMNWKPRSEMWPFTWGVGVLGGTTALTGTYINNYCRGKLGLMTFGRISTFAPTVAIPVMLSTLFHSFLVSNKILIGEFPCTVCAAVRSGAIQSGFGALYPLLLGPLICVANARKYHTYHVPGLSEKGEILPFLRRVMPSPGAMLGMVLLNFGIGMALAERETLLFAKYLSPTTASVEREKNDEEFQ
ncbi:uncharacterized protein [Littorina saxatilis]|uniref:Transmembrane protein 126A n=1 Tax=Littorina saxatilis TaxID=31220 RepID=A0AAN9AP04_9CAEN